MTKLITEETMARLRQLRKDATPHGYDGPLYRYLDALKEAAPSLLDTIDRQQAEITALVGKLKEILPILIAIRDDYLHDDSPRADAAFNRNVALTQSVRGLLANLSSAAEAHNKRLKAEGAAEILKSALQPEEHSIRTNDVYRAMLEADDSFRGIGGGSRDWLEDHFIEALAAKEYVIVPIPCEAGAARLREGRTGE